MVDEIQKEQELSTILDDFGKLVKDFWEKAFGNKERPKDPSKYLFVPDRNDPSTWKLPVHDLKHMGMAAAALGEGFRGEKADLPSGMRAKLRAKLRRMYQSMGEKVPDSLAKEAPLTLYKDDKGQWKWFANYSNNFRDNDHPSEIISKESHQNFVRMVDAGEAKMPELWHWHVKGSKWGQAEWVAYDEENGVAMAAGYVLDGHEKEAEALEATNMVIGVSHGMPTSSIQRSEKDNSIIVRHITEEISDLPLWAAANKLTSFHVFKETDTMAIPENKKQYLRDNNVSDEEIQEIESKNAETKQTAEDMKIESKEESTEQVATDEKKEEQTEETKSEESKEETKESDNVKFVTGEQLAEVITQITKSVTEAVKAINERLDTMDTNLKEMKEKESKETIDPRIIPTASLAALIAQGMSAVGNSDAKVSKKESLSKAGPEETEAKKETPSFGNPVVDSIISNIINGK